MNAQHDKKSAGREFFPALWAWLVGLVLLTAAPAWATSITVDGKVDPSEGYTESYTVPFYAEGGITYYGTMYQTVTQDSVFQAWVLPLEVNDTSYGPASTQDPYNWPGRGRRFEQIVGSDNARFQFMDASGKIILDAFVDNLAKYIMDDGSIQYRTSGVTDGKPYGDGVKRVKQGDGSMVVGSADSFLQVGTSFDYNANNGILADLSNAIYEFEINRAALSGDFTSLMTIAHMSPEKVTLTGIGPPVPKGGAGATPEPGTLLLLGSALAGLAWRRRKKT